MANCQHLVYAILKFLDDQQRSPDLTPDAIESLEVASQCLESAYGVTIRDIDAATLYPLPGSLLEIFSSGISNLSFPAASVGDREQAEKFKAEGNELMKQEQYAPAIECYTRAIQLDSRNAVYFCNRAAAHGKMGEHLKSIEDCRKALELDSKYSKAFGRMGLAFTALGQHREAKNCYQNALSLEPGNDSYRENLRQCDQMLRDDTGLGAVPGALGGMNLGGLNLGGMDISSLLSNPALMNMATSMLSNPQMQQMMASMMSGGTAAAGPGGPPNISSLLQAGQQLAQQMQQSNPELVEQLRTQMRTGPGSQTPGSDQPDNSTGDSS